MRNKSGEVWTNEPFFNADYIRTNHIQLIKGRYSYKNPGKPMYETDFRRVFEFDTLGRIVQVYETKTDDGTVDSTFQKYAYNEKGHLIYYSYGTRSNFTYNTFFYDQSNYLISKETYIQINYVSGESKIVLDRKESYEYKVEGIDTLKITKNSYNLPFKKEWKTYNKEGLVTRLDERYVGNGQGKSEIFEFSETGNLEKKSFKNTRDAYPRNIYTFTYDTLGNVQEKKVINDLDVAQEIQFVYNENNGKLSAILERENDSDFISIIRFQDYRYFEPARN
ncbi:MAG: hypothetical protein KJ941_02720 [Bacteroidetes bacterium]|nr:hypothetical protein [Bacteroidota bacterium]